MRDGRNRNGGSWTKTRSSEGRSLRVDGTTLSPQNAIGLEKALVRKVDEVETPDLYPMFPDLHPWQGQIVVGLESFCKPDFISLEEVERIKVP
jgi:hypothetical protein